MQRKNILALCVYHSHMIAVESLPKETGQYHSKEVVQGRSFRMGYCSENKKLARDNHNQTLVLAGPVALVGIDARTPLGMIRIKKLHLPPAQQEW